MYDSVDRGLLWVVLARFGAPGNMVTVLHQFHKGMRARVGTDFGEHSEQFNVPQGLRQGFVLSSLLNIFFAAVIHAALVRVSQDPDFVRDLFHLGEDLQEDGVGVNMDPPKSVWGAVWGML